MTTRILPPEEWPRLDGTYLEPLWPLLAPESSTVLVVEDADGAIVGTWVLMQVSHIEGLSAANGAVLRALLRKMQALTTERGITKAMSATDTPEIDTLLHRLDPHRIPVPGRQYLWTVPTV